MGRGRARGAREARAVGRGPVGRWAGRWGRLRVGPRALAGAPEAGPGRHGWLGVGRWVAPGVGEWAGRNWAGVEVREGGAVDTRRRLSAPWATLPTGAPATGRGLSGAACGPGARTRTRTAPAPAPTPSARDPGQREPVTESRSPIPVTLVNLTLGQVSPSFSPAASSQPRVRFCALVHAVPCIRPRTCGRRTHRPHPSRPRQRPVVTGVGVVIGGNGLRWSGPGSGGPGRGRIRRRGDRAACPGGR